ncbi:hypothetical protein FBU30_007352 [Linnemannia zychae]|nr:hypothetical protein FBU30_007352 [Linnemannia zychae]
MKANGKEKTSIVATSEATSDYDPSLETPSKQTNQTKESSATSAIDSEGSIDDSKDSATTQPTADQDEDMKEASPITTSEAEKDTHMTEPSPVIKPRNLPGIPEGINQEDLDGGLLDGALDDDDDLDQDTEDTEVGNGDDFSDDDDDDDDDDLDSPPHDPTDKLNDSDTHTPGATSHADTAKSEDPDSDDDMDQVERDEALQTDDSDSDLGDLDASDNDQEDDDDDEGDVDGEDADEADDEEEEEIKPSPKKDSILSQKPTLHRPSITEEELKDSGDELSDLSEFDDTDDSDDDVIPKPKPAVNEPSTSAPPAPPASTSAPTGPATTTTTTTTGSAPGATTVKPTLGGRKRSLHEATAEPVKPEGETIKSEQEDPTEVPIPSGRARLSEPGSRKRRVSEVEDAQMSNKETESEVAEEEETEKQKVEEDEDEAEEDHEMKQLHRDALDALTSIEIEFANLRDKMYEERLTELDREVEMINDGTHPELSSLMQEIEQKREHRLHIADMGRKYKTDIAQSAYNVAEYQAHCTFQSARRNIRTQLVHDLGRKQRQLILELNLSADAHAPTAAPDKSILIRARKLKRAEVHELKAMSEKRCFPASNRLSTVSQAELQDDFALMGMSNLLPQPKPAVWDSQFQAQSQIRQGRQLSPSISMSAGPGSTRFGSNGRWPGANDYPSPPNMPPTGSYYGGRNDVEIHVDGSRCLIDGIWYKPNDPVVVLDAAIGKYNAKYVTLESDWVVLQRTDGSKTRLHLSLFRGRKLCMQPKV